jgi:hypothetical protein
VQGSVLCPVRCSVRRRAYFPLSGSSRSNRRRISDVRGIGSLPLLPFEVDDVDEDPPLSIPELRASLPQSPDSLLFCPRGANLF